MRGWITSEEIEKVDQEATKKGKPFVIRNIA